MKAPFIMKTSFYLPSTSNAKKNSAHVEYIGTRPGVSMETTKDFEELEEKTDAAHHAKYAGERPGSHGLFTQNSNEALVLKDVQKELREHDGVVWRMILSLKEEDALNLGFTEKRKWEDLLRSTVPDAAKKMGITESNLKWIAAFHEEKGHPHVHLMMWEKETKRERGALSKGEHRDVKNVFMNEIYREERQELNLIKTVERDFIREFALDNVVDAVKMLKGLDEVDKTQVGIAPRIHTHDIEKLQKSLYELSKMLPEKGRMSYAFMPDEVKKEVDEISNWLINRPQFMESTERYLSSVEGLTKLHSHDPERIELAKEKAMKDIQKRVSQVLLKGALETRINFSPKVDQEKAMKAQMQFIKANGKPKQDLSYDVTKKSAALLKHLSFSENEIKRVFETWSEKADLGLSEKEIRKSIANSSKEDIKAIDEKDIKTGAEILKLAGWTNNEIISKLNRYDDVLDGIEKVLNKIEKKANSNFVSKKDFSKIEEITDVSVDYPYKLVERSEVSKEDVDKMIETFSQGICRDEAAAGWTAFCMSVALKQSEVSESKRIDVVSEWIRSNEIAGVDLYAINEKIEEGSNFLRKNTWDKVLGNIGVKPEDFKYPFKTFQELEFDEQKADETLLQLENIVVEKMEVPDREHLTEVYARILRGVASDNSLFKEKINVWAKKRKLPQSLVTKVIKKYEKRTNDIEYLKRPLRVQDMTEKTIRDYSKVLFATGMSEEKVKDTVLEWNRRVKSNAPPEKIEKIIEQVGALNEENQRWGKATYVNKESYKQLNETLNVKAPYIYKMPSFKNPNASINKIWKSFWNELEKERMKSEKEMEYARKRMMRAKEQEQKQRQEREERG
ncbi:MobP3 family relaxase [Bacillus thuringiensis]|uniref:MobP3 family relaxase n=3 Tax=Bacillus thuringiensis TaxID=1428 RepID=UPI0007C1D81E|nr:MobP3 family relaxase [Bacillus thuringiensis]AND11171.1 conjugal transfer protein [Bacillus thuringiensis serovar alesti]MEC3599179.1 MobP3 family relaxase [Bacillus thuringiensis]MED2211064.1 MobP3 family relaxase [Bacillus thuringiensis]MED2699101.1 MobP3 family relaxase [Bacillus thuringiensis]MED2716894.1 MobP3 family relaxase [Bacillus thuringiensis]